MAAHDLRQKVEQIRVVGHPVRVLLQVRLNKRNEGNPTNKHVFALNEALNELHGFCCFSWEGH